VGDAAAVFVPNVHPGPLPLILEQNGGFEHFQRRGVGGGFRPAGLAEDVAHLGELADNLVRDLEQLARLGGSEARESGRHVEKVALVERGHELRPEILVRKKPPRPEGPFPDRPLGQPSRGEPVPRQKNPHDDGPRDQDRRPAPFDDEINHGMIEPDEQAVERVPLLGRDSAADEKPHQNRGQGEGQDGRRAHGVGLGVGQRLEQSAFLRLQRENRQEGDRDHQQGVEKRRADFNRGVPDDPPMRFPALVALQVFVRVFDHDDDGVHHGANGNGDAAQRHNVRTDALAEHDQEGHQDREGQDHNRHQGAAQVHQEGQADQGHDEAFFEELYRQRPNRPVNQHAAVINDRAVNVRRQAAHGLVELLLHVLNDLAGIGAVAHDHNAADGFALAVQLRYAAPHVGPQLHRGHLPEQDRHPPLTHPDRHLPQVVQSLEIAPHAQYELLFRPFEGAAADFAVAAPHGRGHVGDRQVVGAQPNRVHSDLVLLDEPAHRGDLRHAFDRSQRIAQIPVLNRAQLGQVAVGGGERIHEGPADPGGIRPECGLDAARQQAGQVAEIFEHAAARPVGIRPVFENHIHEREPIEGIPPHHLGLRHGEHLGGDGVGELVLHDLGRLPGPFGINDHLHIREVGNGIQPRMPDGVNPAHPQHGGA